MRRVMLVLLAAALLPGLAQAAEAKDELKAIIDKAIKAHGGKKMATLSKGKAVQIKSKGKIELAGGIDYTDEVRAQKGKFKQVMELQIKGKAYTQTVVYNGKQAWVNGAGMTVELKDKQLEAVKEAVALGNNMDLAFLQDKKVKFSALGEAKVNNQPAVGVRVTRKGHKDVNMYFDKKSGLLAKLEHRTIDAMTGQEVGEERIVLSYQTISGVKMAKKVLIQRDDKKFIEAEVTEVKFVDLFDDSEFAKP